MDGEEDCGWALTPDHKRSVASFKGGGCCVDGIEAPEQLPHRNKQRAQRVGTLGGDGLRSVDVRPPTIVPYNERIISREVYMERAQSQARYFTTPQRLVAAGLKGSEDVSKCLDWQAWNGWIRAVAASEWNIDRTPYYCSHHSLFFEGFFL